MNEINIHGNMANEEVISYVKKALELGYSSEEIKKNLSNSGWSELEISEAFRTVMGGGLRVEKGSPLSPQNASILHNYSPKSPFNAQNESLQAQPESSSKHKDKFPIPPIVIIGAVFGIIILIIIIVVLLKYL